MKEETRDTLTKHTFVYRPYTKSELAQMYMPNYIKKVALRNFNHWLRQSPILWESLITNGFNITSRDLTYQQVVIIVNYLGEP